MNLVTRLTCQTSADVPCHLEGRWETLAQDSNNPRVSLSTAFPPPSLLGQATFPQDRDPGAGG